MADDTVEVQIKADSSQVNAAAGSMAEAVEESTSSVKGSLDRLDAASEKAANAFVQRFRLMGEKAQESSHEINEGIESIEKRLNSLHKAFSTLGEIAIAGFVGDWIAEQVKSIGEYGEALEHMQQETGITAEKLQELSYAGAAVGLSTDTAQRAMGLLSRKLAEAQGGAKPAIEAFKQVGIAGSDLKNLSLDQVLGKIADAFAAHADGSQKAALAMELFGRSGRDLIPILDQGGEGLKALGVQAHDVGAVIDQETVEAMAKLGRDLNILEADARATANEFKGKLAVAIDELVVAMLDLFSKGSSAREFFDDLARFIRETTVVVLAAINGLKQLGDIINALSAAADDLGGGNFKKAMSDLSNGWQSVKKDAQDYDAAVARIAGEGPKGRGEREGEKPKFGVVSRGGSGDSTKGALAEAQAIAAANLSLLKEQLTEEAKQNEEAYKTGAISLKAYYAERLRIEQDGLSQEMAVKRAEFNAVRAQESQTADAGKLMELKAKEIEINGQLAVLDQKYAFAAKENAQQLTQAYKAQTDQLALLAAQKAVAIGTQGADQQKAITEAQVKAGEAGAKQLLQVEVNLENQRFALQKTELEAELQLVRDTKGAESAEYVKANNAIEIAESEHQTKLTQLAIQGAADQAKAQQEAASTIENAFSGLFDNLAQGQKNIKQIFTDFFNSIDQGLTKLIAKQLTNQLFSADSAGGGALKSFTSFLTGKSGSVTSSIQNALGGGSGTGGAGTLTTGAMSVATANIATVPTMSVAEMTVASMLSAGGAGGGGDSLGGFSSLLGAFGGAGGAGGFSLAGTSAADAGGIAGGETAAMGGLSSAGGVGLSGLGGSLVGAVAAYANGTNYVPATQLALIHKGEAVVPARYNNQGTPGAVSVTNHFSLGQATDLRTQSQIAHMAASALSRASKRNG